MIANVRKIFTQSSQQSIAAGAMVVAFFGVASRLLGVVRDRILAAQYGAGDALDVYYAAFRLPDLIFELLVVGALGAAFIPIFSKLMTLDNMERAWRCAHGVLVTLILVIAGLSCIGAIFAPTLIHLIVPGFPEDKMMETAHLTRIMFFSPIFLAASAVLGGVLVSFRRFVYNSMAPIFYNIGIIIGAKFFAPVIGIEGLAWGVVLGSMMHFGIHFFDVRRVGFRFMRKIHLPFKNSDVVETLTLMVPRMFSSASSLLSLLLVTFFASTLAAGSITIFTFANNIQSVVLGLIGIPFALAAFPVLSNKYATGDTEAFASVLSQTLRRILYYSVPLSAIFFVLREEIVRIVYGAGNFDANDTTVTYQVLGIMCIGLFAQSIIPLLSRGFYAMCDTKTPLYIALGSQALNIIMIILLIRSYGIYAIAAAFTVTVIVNAFLLFGYLHRSIDDGEYRDTLRTILQIGISTFIVIVLTVFVRNVTGAYLPLQYVWGVLVQLISAGAIGAVSYLFVTAIFGVREYETIKKKIIIRIFGRPQVATEVQKIGL